MTLFRREATRNDGPIDFVGDSLVINLEWDLSADLDLAAVCDAESDNEIEMVFFDQPGRRSSTPFVHLLGDSSGAGRTKFRKEHMVITRASANRAIHIFVWDHRGVMEGEAADFLNNNDSVTVKAIDGNNQVVSAALFESRGVNCVHVFTIENNTIEVVDKSMRIPNTEKLAIGLVDLIKRHRASQTAEAV